MPWFKVDDSLPMSRKVIRIPRERRATALGLWVLAGAWSSHELTDGHVPGYAVDEWADPDVAADLVKVGLWDAVDDGYQFHDWEDYNPDAKSEKAKNQAKSAGGKRGNHERWHVKRGVQVPDCEYCQEVPSAAPSTSIATRSLPDRSSESGANPPKPIPNKRESARSRGTRLPDDWTPDDDLKRWTSENCPGLHGPTTAAKFRDYWHSVPGAKGVKLDWEATWRNWCRREHEGMNR